MTVQKGKWIRCTSTFQSVDWYLTWNSMDVFNVCCALWNKVEDMRQHVRMGWTGALQQKEKAELKLYLRIILFGEKGNKAFMQQASFSFPSKRQNDNAIRAKHTQSANSILKFVTDLLVKLVHLVFSTKAHFAWMLYCCGWWAQTKKKEWHIDNEVAC